MKIEAKKQEFQAVVITLETQEEIDQMFAIVNHMCFDEAPDITHAIYEKLEDMHYHDYYLSDGSNKFRKEG